MAVAEGGERREARAGGLGTRQRKASQPGTMAVFFSFLQGGRMRYGCGERQQRPRWIGVIMTWQTGSASRRRDDRRERFR